MMRGPHAKRGPALLLTGCMLAGCAAALAAANGAPARTDPCPRIGAQDIHIRESDSGDAIACPAGSIGVSNALGGHAGNAATDPAGANATADTGNAAGPGDATEGLSAKPKRAPILSRSWRQIFPRAN